MLDFKNASLDLDHTERNAYVSLSKSRINTQSVLFINLRSIDMYLTRHEYTVLISGLPSSARNQWRVRQCGVRATVTLVWSIESVRRRSRRSSSTTYRLTPWWWSSGGHKVLIYLDLPGFLPAYFSDLRVKDGYKIFHEIFIRFPF